MSDTNALARIRRAGNLREDAWNDDRIETVKRMVAPESRTVHELAAFLTVCERYGLDPLLGEAWLGNLNGKPTVITGRDSYIKIAQRDYADTYLGFDSGVVYSKDTFEIERAGERVTVTHQIPGMERGERIGAYCVVYDRVRRPVVIVRKWSDYAHLHNRSTWKQNGDDMIETRAIVAALRRQYTLAGLYTAADGAAEPDEATEPARATHDRLEELQREIRTTASGSGEPTPRSDEVQDVEYEVLDSEQSDDAGSGRGAYFARLREVAPDASQAQRQDWQEYITGKGSSRDWETADFAHALQALEAGEGFDRLGLEAPAPAAEGELPL